MYHDIHWHNFGNNSYYVHVWNPLESMASCIQDYDPRTPSCILSRAVSWDKDLFRNMEETGAAAERVKGCQERK